MNPAAEARLAAERDAFEARVAQAPFDFDLWNFLRWIDALNPQLPPLGRSPRPRLEPLRIGQEPSLAFAPAQICGFDRGGAAGVPRLTILGFGLFGPNGPLPTHLTDYARERLRARGDPTFVRFCDLFHHRFTLFFYRAWAATQPTVCLDRPETDAFARFVGSLVHLGDDTLKARDAVPDHAKIHFAGHLVRETRNAEGIARILQVFLRAGVAVEQWVGQWLPLAAEQRTRLGGGRQAEQLGVGTVAGATVPDAQGRFRLRVGALTLADYEQHLPGGRYFPQVLAWLRNYIGFEFAWDVRLVLRRDEVPGTRLGGSTRLGFTSWLGTRITGTDADDLVLAHEYWAQRAAAGRP